MKFVFLGTPYISDCVMAELEKLGPKFRVALRQDFDILIRWLTNFRIAKDPRFERLPCSHQGTYADDCIVERVTMVILSSKKFSLL